MSDITNSWDYLVLTASNALQAEAYERQLTARKELGMLPQVRNAFVVPDIGGRRIGSGGSTLWCLVEILERERLARGIQIDTSDQMEQVLRSLRILIVHAGGDSRRLPAYGPCGKIFVPLPQESGGNSGGPMPPTLFDRLVPEFLALPPSSAGQGQVVVTSGDALIFLDAAQIECKQGLTAVACYASPEEASRHGVFCLNADSAVTLYLQKPSLAAQAAQGAIGEEGQTPLDIGVMNFDAAGAAALLRAFEVAPGALGRLDFSKRSRRRILEHGVDLYREICCALGSHSTLEHYLESAAGSGSTWPVEELAEIYPALRSIPFHAQMVPSCRFLHFGSTGQLIESGLALTGPDAPTILNVNSEFAPEVTVSGRESWIEGCRVGAALELGGRNVLVGVDVQAPLSLPREACLEVLAGRNRRDRPVWFVRCYGIRDTFKHSIEQGGLFCGRPLLEWLAAACIAADEVWPDTPMPAERTLWNARVFPAMPGPADYRRWLWMYAPETASAEERTAFHRADRHSAAEIAVLTDQNAFHSRRIEIWKGQAR
jgi:fucokinase